MQRSPHTLVGLLRGAALGSAVGAMFVAGHWHLAGLHADLARGALLLLAVGMFVPRSILLRPALPVALLAADLVAVASMGAFLGPQGAGSEAATGCLPFLAGYLVAVLVAVTGRRHAAAALGFLAGAMLLLLGESTRLGDLRALPLPAAAGGLRAVADAEGPLGAGDLVLWLRLLLIGVAAFECGALTSWIDADHRRRRTAELVERELRAREMLATEMASFVAAGKSAGSLRELAEALVVHLRARFPTEARAVFLEDATERVAIWEEAGKPDERGAELRRLRLQEALREAGSTALVPRLDTRSTVPRGLVRAPRRPTGVGVPVHGTGRVGGLIFLADSRRAGLDADRLAALAELARQTGDVQRRIERARDEQTRRTSLLLGQMREGVLLLGGDGRVLMSNPAGRAMLAALGQSPDTPVTLGEASPAELASVATGGVRRWTVGAVGEAGRAMRLAVAAVGVADEGTRLGTLVTMADVTEEEQARSRLVQVERMSVVGQTIASVAHELNNPLAAIVGYADLLAETRVTPEVEGLLARIREQATRTSRIVRNLLNVVRRRGPERSRVPLNDVVASVLDLFAYDARLSNVTLTPRLDPDLPPVLADRHAIQQVLVNLVQNALHAVRSRGGGGQVEVLTRRERGNVCLTVRDDGPGVLPEARPRLFEAFFTTKGPEEGTGLGLAISRGIAREHGGDLVLEDRADGRRGAQFTLRVPLEAPPADPAPAREKSIPEGVPARVLVVDDEGAVRESLVATLGRMGAQADGADSAEQAGRRLQDTPYDAVLMDVRLPGRSGIEVYRELRESNAPIADRVVFMTGDLVNDDVMRAVRATGLPCMEKPFTAEELRGVLGRVGTARRAT